MQDESGFLFEADAPSVEDSDEAILASIAASGVTEKPPTETANGSFKNLIYSLASQVSFPIPQINNLTHVPSDLRINFPTLGKDQAPASLLGTFLEVLGRKADSLEDHLVPWIVCNLEWVRVSKGLGLRLKLS